MVASPQSLLPSQLALGSHLVGQTTKSSQSEGPAQVEAGRRYPGHRLSEIWEGFRLGLVPSDSWLSHTSQLSPTWNGDQEVLRPPEAGTQDQSQVHLLPVATVSILLPSARATGVAVSGMPRALWQKVLVET